MKEFTWTSIDRTAVDDGFHFIDLIAPRPLLTVTGREALSKWQSEEAIKAAHEPKAVSSVGRGMKRRG